MGIRKIKMEIEANQVGGVFELLKWYGIEFNTPSWYWYEKEGRITLIVIAKRPKKKIWNDFMTAASEGSYTINFIR